MTADEKTDPVSKALAKTTPGRDLPMLTERFQPRNLTELMTWAKLVVASGLVPHSEKTGKGMNQAGVVICVQMGAELDISPAQAIQNMAVINGRPSIYGDLGLAIFFRDAAYKTFEERAPDECLKKGEGWCRIEMKDGRVIERTFSMVDAKTAHLWGKAGPWTNYPGRMFMFRARWWAMRDSAPGVFKGCNSREEMEDIRDTEFRVHDDIRRESEIDPKEVDEFLKGDKATSQPTRPTTKGKEPAPDLPNPWVGKFVKIETFKVGKGKKTNLYIFKAEDGTEFKSFDSKIVEHAKDLGKGTVVDVFWNQDEHGLGITGIDPHVETEAPPTASGASGAGSNLFDEKG